MIRALLAIALLLLAPRLAQAETLSLSFVPHPAHEAIVVGEMVPVTIRGIYDRKVARENLEIAPSDNFDWIQSAPDRWRDEMIDGKPFLTLERDIVVVPKRDGVLHFGPATHEITIIDEESQRRDRTVIAPPLTLSVGAYPAERGWPWVAEEVTLTDELSTDPARLVDGETVIRRVTLRARGTLPEALPPRPIVSEPWLISFAAPVERRVILTAEGPVSEVVWVWQFRPETGEPGVISAMTIPYFDASTRRMATLEIPALPVGYASFYSNQVQTGRFGSAPRLAGAGALLAGILGGAALVLARQAPDTGRAAWSALRRRWSPLRRWRLRQAARKGDLIPLRRLLADTHPEARDAAALVDAAIYAPTGRFDPAAFRRALKAAEA